MRSQMLPKTFSGLLKYVSLYSISFQLSTLETFLICFSQSINVTLSDKTFPKMHFSCLIYSNQRWKGLQTLWAGMCCGMTALCVGTAWKGSTPSLSCLHVSSLFWLPRMHLKWRINSVREEWERIGWNIFKSIFIMITLIRMFKQLLLHLKRFSYHGYNERFRYRMKSSSFTWEDIFIELFIVLLFISVFIVQ